MSRKSRPSSPPRCTAGARRCPRRCAGTLGGGALALRSGRRQVDAAEVGDLEAHRSDSWSRRIVGRRRAERGVRSTQHVEHVDADVDVLGDARGELGVAPVAGPAREVQVREPGVAQRGGELDGPLRVHLVGGAQAGELHAGLRDVRHGIRGVVVADGAAALGGDRLDAPGLEEVLRERRPGGVGRDRTEVHEEHAGPLPGRGEVCVGGVAQHLELLGPAHGRQGLAGGRRPALGPRGAARGGGPRPRPERPEVGGGRFGGFRDVGELTPVSGSSLVATAARRRERTSAIACPSVPSRSTAGMPPAASSRRRCQAARAISSVSDSTYHDPPAGRRRARRGPSSSSSLLRAMRLASSSGWPSSAP